jgi:hypothetical protein
VFRQMARISVPDMSKLNDDTAVATYGAGIAGHP